MNLNIFISQPMDGKSEEQILKEREEIQKAISALGGIYSPSKVFSGKEDPFVSLSFIPSYFEKGNEKPVWCLGESIKALSDADIVVFAKGWETARGCIIEHEVCEKYGIRWFEL